MARKEVETRAVVVERKDLSSDLTIIKLQPQFECPTFKPGQYCTIGLSAPEFDLEYEERAYSIVSGPHELPTVELFIELVPEEYRVVTSLTPRILGGTVKDPVRGELTFKGVQVGETVGMRKRAVGAFLLDENCPNHVFISTVTGVVPFVSMIRSHFKANFYGKEFNKWGCWQGASYMNEFGYLQELKMAAALSKGKLVYVPTVSRPTEAPNAGWKGVTGRVNAIVEEQMAQRGFNPGDTTVYLCGNEKMIEVLGNRTEVPAVNAAVAEILDAPKGQKKIKFLPDGADASSKLLEYVVAPDKLAKVAVGDKVAKGAIMRLGSLVAKGFACKDEVYF